MESNIRVRFAPSPTGYLHIGGVRTALYNFLFARKNQGTFVLRIEDTDAERSDTAFTESILRSMDWLGLKPDEGPGINENFGPYYQSERKQKGIYKEYADKLLAEGKAYYCYCTPEELDAKRKHALAEKRPPRYDGTCRNLTEEVRSQKSEVRKVVRFKNDGEGELVMHDIIRGDISFDKKNLDDFIIVKSDGLPVYNFACVVDDALMEISHVIRGDDHISNTPRQILLYEALGFPLPQFAHIPMILGSDKARLSKRHGATSVEAYKDEGYLPEALLNFLARLGWAYDDKQEIFSMEELIEKFSLEAVSKNPAVFNPEKLLWLDSHYIMQKSDDALADMIFGILESQGIVKGAAGSGQGAENQATVLKAIPLIKERMKTLKEAAALLDFLFVDEVKIDEQAKQKFLTKPETLAALKDMAELLSTTEPFTHAELETRIKNFVAEKNLKLKDILQPLRVILTGKTVSPPLLESMEILGKVETLERLNKFLTEQ